MAPDRFGIKRFRSYRINTKRLYGRQSKVYPSGPQTITIHFHHSPTCGGHFVRFTPTLFYPSDSFGIVNRLWYSSTETNPQKNTNPGMDVNNPINLDTPIAQPPISVNVTPTRQEPLQVGFDNAVDLLDICESLLPGHGQFSCHFKYLYFFMNSERCYLNETAYPGINTEIQTFELLFVILLLRKKGILLFS